MAAALPVNPALLQHAQDRLKSWENRVADRITRFAGSMRLTKAILAMRATRIRDA